ncbi:hypothetical protein IV38_GL000508 [Lactobacillus selangorensis]|uniref:Uncharacterized protein n=1 Tax=Lactobacillus selangorensis TaxID=81857 RepID=A0A0R2FZA8_9LACO|nr:hypothetical protein [Lactobacillus selangorensis]KRN29621.1 hypothetical protein IV38_GL000508 [Lactobacillus selangorensis]KRN33849.1 hypothetical protein IV40_GL000160 [Lactobacillus selangorensis]
MTTWIYVVYYQTNTTMTVLRAFNSEQRAKDFVAVLTTTPYPEYPLADGGYSYQRIPLY